MRTMFWLGALALAACGSSGGDKAGDSGSAATGTGTGGGTPTGTTTGTTTTTPPDPGGLAIAFVPLNLRAGANVQDGKVLDLGDGHMLSDDRQDIEVAPGLTLSVSTADLEPPLFNPDPTWVDAVQVPPADMLPVELNGTVLDMWYMGPFDYHSGGVPVSIANTYGVDTSTQTIELWVGSYESSAWERVGQANDTGGVLVFDRDLKLISTIVLIDATGETNPPAGEPAGGAAQFTGTVTGPDGSPLEGARVQYCRGDQCLTEMSDGSGSFTFADDLDTGPGSFEIIPPFEG